jgi:hypothetical protein
VVYSFHNSKTAHRTRVFVLSARRRAVAFLKTENSVEQELWRAENVTAFWQMRLLVTSNLIKLSCCSRVRRGERVRTPKAFGVATEIEMLFM